jgi:conjugative relaxase-like TrwC/TraI family protein
VGVVIATIKVLGLKARDFAAVAAAARRVVEYVQGRVERSPRPSPQGYYAGGDVPVKGRARGSAAALVGLRGEVPAEQLQRLLTGRHAVTGRWLLPATGSAGRAGARLPRPPPPLGELPEALWLADAAGIAGVSSRYLARLASERAFVEAATPSGKADEATCDGVERRPPRDHLHARRDPETGRWMVPREELARFMTEREPPTVVIGYDLTCAVPKSLSLLWAFGDESLREDIAAALDAGVNAALAYLERHATFGTVGGKNRPGLGLAVASYRHEISRAEEPHLHDHNIIVNGVPVPLIEDDASPVLDERGVARVEWRALDSEVLHAHVKTSGYVGAAALRQPFARLRGLPWGPVRNGVAELAGFPAGLLEPFSSRHGETHEEFAQLVDAGFAPDAATLAAAQRGSRKAKRVLPDAAIAAIQRRRLAAAGWAPEQVRALGATRERRPTAPGDEEISALFDRLAGPRGVTERQSTFTARDACQQVAAWAADRLDGEAIERIAERFLADPGSCTSRQRRAGGATSRSGPSRRWNCWRPKTACWPCAGRGGSTVAPFPVPRSTPISSRQRSPRSATNCGTPPAARRRACPVSRPTSCAPWSPPGTWPDRSSARPAPGRPRRCGRSCARWPEPVTPSSEPRTAGGRPRSCTNASTCPPAWSRAGSPCWTTQRTQPTCGPREQRSSSTRRPR